MIQKIKTLLSKIQFKSRLSTSLHTLLGSASWIPPHWLQFLYSISIAKLAILRRNKPKVFWASITLSLIIGMTGGVTWRWYQNLPKPTYIEVTINSPLPTNYSIEELRPHPAIINFNESAARLELIGKKVDKGLTLSPALPGEWQWTDDKTLLFTPEKDWAANQTYQVKLSKTLFPDHVLLKKLDYEFSSPAFGADCTKAEFYQDPTNAKNKTVEATFRFTHPIDIDTFQKNLIVTKESQGKNKKITTEPWPVTFSFDKFKREIYVHSSNLTPMPEDSFLIITLKADMSATGDVGKLPTEISKRVLIPSQYNFFHVQTASSTIITNEQSTPEQVLILRTTDGVQTSELQKNLKVYLLPKDLPATNSTEIKQNYLWQSPKEVTNEILNQSTLVELNPIATEKDYDTLQSFRYKQPEGRFLYIKINAGLKSFGNYSLSSTFDSVSQTATYPKSVNIMGSGSLLALNGDRKLSIISRGLDGIQRTLYRINPKDINNLVSQTAGQFQNPYFENYNFTEENIAEVFSDNYPLNNEDPSVAQYEVVDFAKYLSSQKGLFLLRVTEWDPQEDILLNFNDKRLVLVTDLGLIIKDNSDNTHDVFVQSLETGGPVSDTTIEVIGKNGEPVTSVNTDEQGHAHLPDLSGLSHEKTPVAYLAKKNDDLSFIPYKREDRVLDYYQFDVGGVTLGGQETLQASIFSDRGIYRPGEKIQTGIIVKSSTWNEQLENIPLEIIFTNPRGLTVQKQKVTLPNSGFLEASYQTDETSAAGIYQVSAYVIKDDESTLLGSTAVHVEDFLPDTMKIQTSFSEKNISGWVAPDALKGEVTLNNLYGTPATDRRLQARLTLTPISPTFPNYAKYSFYNPYKLKEGFSENLPDQKTNEKGQAEFDFQLARYSKATYRLNFFTEGFSAEGGRGVKSESTVLVSPMTYLIGAKTDGSSSFLKKDSKHSVNLIAINAELKPIEKDKLKIVLIEKKHVSVLTQQTNGTFKYQSTAKEITVSENPITIPNTGLDYSLATDKGGDFELRILDTDTQVGAINYSVADNTNLSRSLDKSAELIMSLDKKEYHPGDDIELSIKAPYEGHGLITLERDQVTSYQWFHSSTTASIQKIHIPENFTGNGYINVAFMRDKNSPEIFMSPLSYAVLPFTISLEQYQEPIEIQTLDLVKPGDELTVQYKTAHPSQIIIYAVDEGILQFAGYKTPDPLSNFFQKRALEVETMQTINLILPEYSLFKQVAAVGGDEAYKLIGNNLNPFKRKTNPPVIYWSGIINADQNEKELNFKIPDYFNGSIRLMAVAVTNDKIGVVQKTTQVRGPFVISPNAPLFVSPDDRFDVSLTLANNVIGSGNDAEISLSLATSPELEIIGDKSQKIKISENTEKPAHFKIKTNNQLGNASLIFTASFGSESAQSTTTLSVRASTPYMTRLKQGTLQSGKAIVDVSEALYPNYRTLKANLSPLPLSLSKGLLSFLEGYPYGCTEQVISKAFPVIALNGIEGFDIDSQKANDLFDKTLHILRSRQNDNGSFMYWPNTSNIPDDQIIQVDDEEDQEDEENENDAAEYSDNSGEEEDPDINDTRLDSHSIFATLYALHFLTDATELGYPVPADMLTNGKNYLVSYLEESIENPEQANLYAYALYLLTRNGEVTSNYLANLRDYLDNNSKTWKTEIIGGYVAATYKLLQQTDESNNLIKSYKDSAKTKGDFYDTTLTNNAQYFYLISKHFPEMLKNFDDQKIQTILKPILNSEYTTLSSAYSILSLQAYSTMTKNDMSHAEISELDKNKKTEKLTLDNGTIKNTTFTDTAQQILFAAESQFPIYYQTIQSGFDVNQPTKEIKQGLEIQREYRNEKGEVINKIPVGSDVEVHLKVRAINDNEIEDIVIVELLPGGFDLMNLNTLLAGQSAKPTDNSWSPDYVDAREDRAILFGRIDKDTKEFVYKIKATNIGEYQTPGIFAESMYNSKIMARGISGKISVVER